MTSQYLRADLERDEGKAKLDPATGNYLAYKDSRGFWTIYVGHNVSADPGMLSILDILVTRGITVAQGEARLDRDIASVEARLDKDLPWWRQLSDIRQDVMVNLAFNIGEGKMLLWKHTLGDIQAGRFVAAEIDLENDEPWASQVHDRSKRMALQMETDQHQD